MAALSLDAAGVTGAAEGFAKGVTGGGSAAAVYPKTNDELVSYLTDSSARTIILTKTFDFTGTEGKRFNLSQGCHYIDPFSFGYDEKKLDEMGYPGVPDKIAMNELLIGLVM